MWIWAVKSTGDLEFPLFKDTEIGVCMQRTQGDTEENLPIWQERLCILKKIIQGQAENVSDM